MNIKKEVKNFKGQNFNVITVTNKLGFEVCFTDLGAGIFYMGFPNKEGKFQYVTVAQKNLEEFVLNGANYGKIIGRVAGRIKDGKCTIQGKPCQIEISSLGNTLHSASSNTVAKIWDYNLIEKDDSMELHFTYRCPDGESGFIGNVDLETIYYINDNEMSIGIDLIGTPDCETLVNLTNHIYFNLNGGVGLIDDQVLYFDCDKVSKLDDTLAVLGFEEPIKELDYRIPTRLGDNINQKVLKDAAPHGMDHLFLFNNPTMDHCSIRLTDPTLGRTMEVYTDAMVSVTYAENYPFDDYNLAGAYEKEGYAITFETAYPTHEEKYYTHTKDNPFVSHTKYVFKQN